jgi:hypothetical protein
MSLLPSGAIESAGYDINNSLRFRASASTFLSRTPASAGNRQTWTASFWMKKGALGTSPRIFSTSDLGSNDFAIDFSGDSLNLWGYVAANVQLLLTTTAVYRDPSAWYHVVVAIDTTQATSSNRAKLYVNGSQVTSFSTATYPAQNTSFLWNSTAAARIGIYQTGSSAFDGYIAEMHFIDGQALTPSSFGETDAITGVWKAKKFTGTYGTNGFYLPFTSNSNTAYAVYTTDVSSNYHSLPTGSQGTNFTFSGDFTVEGWVLFPSNIGDHSLYVSNSGSTYFALNIDVTNGVYNIYCNSSSPTSSFSSGIPVGNWTHVAMVRSGSTITLYTNGVARGTITNSSTLGYSSLTLNRFGGGSAGTRYMSNVRITKSAIYTANFVPPTTALTNVANTVVLTYQNSTAIDNSSNGYTLTATGSPSLVNNNLIWNANVVVDASGNKNTWTPNNLNYSTLGTTYDAMKDSPTLTSATVANYPVYNSLIPSSVSGSAVRSISAGNLYVTQSGANGWSAIGTTMVMTSGSGKWYWEVTCSGTVSNGVMIGIHRPFTSTATFPSPIIGYDSPADPDGYGYYMGGNKYNNSGSGVAYGASYTAGDVIGVALDMSTAGSASITFYKNNTSQGVAFSSLTGDFFAAVSQTQATGLDINFGQRPFTYTPPTGFVALNTYNLPDSTIKKGNSYMDATAYTGTNGSPTTQVISSNFQPDFLWFKKRSASYDHALIDTNRGITKQLYSNLTNAEGTDSDVLTAIGASSFTVGNSNYSNYGTLVAWTWKANGGTTSSNTAGSITSTVQANTTAGFSIVTYAGTLTSAGVATVGHGLGVAPKMIISKSLGTSQWVVQHTSLTSPSYFLYLNTTDAQDNKAGNGTMSAPTSTVFSTNWTTGLNVSGSNLVAYCFAEIAGFSKFGSYTGNGSSDGPFVYLGFRPKFILFKVISEANGWVIYDTSRDTYNYMGSQLYPHLSNAETVNAAYAIDATANGFKIRTSNGVINVSSGTFIYAAFAESPFKNSLAR